jgi:hypothetical protein
MILTLDYLRADNDNYIVEIINLNQTLHDEYIPTFLADFEQVANDTSLSAEEGTVILAEKLYDIREEEMKKAWSVTMYTLAPVITMPAVVFFHIWFWTWVSDRFIKLFKLRNDTKPTLPKIIPYKNKYGSEERAKIIKKPWYEKRE